MKVGIIADQHIGIRNDSQIFSKYCIDFFKNEFIPNMKAQGITNIFHLGDVFDRRKYINFKTLNDWREGFFDVLLENNLTMHIIVGNHDVYYKNSNYVNSMQLLSSYENLLVYENPTTLSINGYKVFLSPWIPQGLELENIDAINQTNAEICFGHFELTGFDMFAGHESSHGLSPSLLNKFDIVLSGHYHHRSTKGNITYVGSPYGMTWSDYGDARGYHIFDFTDRSLQFFENSKSLFMKCHYNEHISSIDDINSHDFSIYTDKYVKVIIENKSNPFLLEKYLENIYSSSPSDVSIIDNIFEKSNENIMVDISKDTRSLLVDYVRELQVHNESDIISFLTQLYDEAINLKLEGDS
jgi:predicted phosphodiesterase